MADETARKLQYEYKANSNLVLQADTRLIERRSKDEATGEVMSLTNKLLGTRMGDRHLRMKPKNEDKVQPKKSSNRDKKENLSTFNIKATSLSEMDDMVALTYTPKSEVTKEAYEVVLSFIQEALDEQPRDILCGAADEVLIALKSDKVKDSEKQKEIETFLGPLKKEKFHALVNLGKKITDFGMDGGAKAMGGAVIDDEIDDTHGVNVQFHDSDEEEEEDDEEGYEDEIDDDGEDMDDGAEGAIHSQDQEGKAPEVLAPDAKVKELSPHDIGAHWLQRELNALYHDPIEAQKKATDVLAILKSVKTNGECEGRLVRKLGPDKFSFIKVLRDNRNCIHYCTILAQVGKLFWKKWCLYPLIWIIKKK